MKNLENKPRFAGSKSVFACVRQSLRKHELLEPWPELWVEIEPKTAQMQDKLDCIVEGSLDIKLIDPCLAHGNFGGGHFVLNLAYEEAAPELTVGLTRSLGGLF